MRKLLTLLIVALCLSTVGLARSGPNEPARMFAVERNGAPFLLGPIAAGHDQHSQFETSWVSGGLTMTVRTWRRPSESDPSWALRHAQLVDAFLKQFPKDAQGSDGGTGAGSAIGTLPNRDQVVAFWVDARGHDQAFVATRQPGEPPPEFQARALGSLKAMTSEFPPA